MAPPRQKTILITGSTRGCGRALAARFIEAGHLVIGCGRSADSLAEMQRAYSEPHRFDVVDVADHQQVAAWAKSVLEYDRIPDLLINNAGIINRPAPLWKITAEEFQQIVNINIVGTANVIREFVPAMVQRRRGVIVNFSSGWGRSTSPEVASYCATKYAIEGLTSALAQELPSGMTAVALNPGIINTELLQSCWAEYAHQYPSPEEWSHQAAPCILQLEPSDNGRSLSIE